METTKQTKEENSSPLTSLPVDCLKSDQLHLRHSCHLLDANYLAELNLFWAWKCSTWWEQNATWHHRYSFFRMYQFPHLLVKHYSESCFLPPILPLKGNKTNWKNFNLITCSLNNHFSIAFLGYYFLFCCIFQWK